MELWRESPVAYPFQWTALWPLLAVSLVSDRTTEALECAGLLLDSTQQRLPEALTRALEEALTVRDRGEAELARDPLETAVALAQEIGHL